MFMEFRQPSALKQCGCLLLCLPSVGITGGPAPSEGSLGELRGVLFQQLFQEEENEECFQEATSLLEHTRTAMVALVLCSQSDWLQNSNLRPTGQLPPRQDGHRKHAVLSPAERFFVSVSNSFATCIYQ